MYVAMTDDNPEDHPRMCGKDSHHTSHCSWLAGSPPHVRERRSVMPVDVWQIRITPACAGKTNTI